MKAGRTPSAWKFLHQINQGFTFLFAQQVLLELVAVAPTVGDRPGYFMHSTVACIVCICVFGELPKSNFLKTKKNGTCMLYPEGHHPSQTRGNCYQPCKSPHRWIQRTVFACEKESKTARCPLVVLVIVHPPALSGLVDMLAGKQFEANWLVLNPPIAHSHLYAYNAYNLLNQVDVGRLLGDDA